ncbi:MAG: hypothetical protein BWY76_02585 [bacterium ADurb.Bin429]|nr:MAG: hypothetical protein BWY76_02585 [bacterium ADurb.Bin429]
MKFNVVSLFVMLGLLLTIGVVLADDPQGSDNATPRQGCRMQQHAGGPQGGGCAMQAEGKQGCGMRQQAGACAKGENCPKCENCDKKGTDQCPKQNGTCPKMTGSCPKQGQGKAGENCPMKGQAAGPAQVASWPSAALTGAVTELANTPGAPVTLAINGQKVLVGSQQAVRALGLELANGQQITVTGWKAEHSGRSTVIAGAVTVGEKSYTIRDANGRPVWAGQGRGQGMRRGQAACH